MLKLGTAAAWLTALESAATFALEDAPVLVEEDAVLDGVELELELPGLPDDEHAASSIAAPTAVTPKATRDARGACLPSLKLLMRPRISHPGLTRP